MPCVSNCLTAGLVGLALGWSPVVADAQQNGPWQTYGTENGEWRSYACAGKARSRGTRCRDVIFETLFETLWVSNPIRPRSAASRNRVMRGPGVTQGAKRSQGARRPRD